MGGEIMTLCNCKCSCSLFSLVAGLIIGVIAAFLQITGTITVTTVFLWVAAGVAAVYLGLLLLTSGVQQNCSSCGCLCDALNTLLLGALGTILFAAILLAVGIVATSVLSAILVGLLVASFTVLMTGTTCVIRNLFDCGN
jgi:hypothetical protein